MLCTRICSVEAGPVEAQPVEATAVSALDEVPASKSDRGSGEDRRTSFFNRRSSVKVEEISIDFGVSVTFVTDVEGNFDYLMRVVAINSALTLLGVNDADGSLDLALADGWHFVYGGDSVDKGGAVGGSMRVVRTLLRLKRKYPTRCTLILGNRDLNKMRMTSELAAEEIAKFMTVPGMPWVAEAKRVSVRAHLARTAAAAADVAVDDVGEEQMARLNTLTERLRALWLLIAADCHRVPPSAAEYAARATACVMASECPPSAV